MGASTTIAAWWAALTGSEQAAWVQAVGSVLAILIAIAIPLIGALLAARRSRRASHQRMLNALLRIYDPIYALRTSLDEFHTTSDPDYDANNPIVSVDPSNGNFQSLIPGVMATSVFLDDLGPVAPKMRAFLFEVINLDQFWKLLEPVSRTGSPGFYRNNVEDIRLRIHRLIEKSDEMLKEIEEQQA
ncbi:hypothetical protein [Pseudoxanthomonas winnipegensis]|uniref:hypothetical protein n=1 Tax=Pseudoxanthomonas winnipegensis TaxID=2480810 RepID=UPI001040ACD2|nr:hypothetical protein [Pseudoxanthomonas winnipegensis]TBV70620.1 hypothetical protein EYC45_18180 [Pseudoxanthomonas winnipegensis]